MLAKLLAASVSILLTAPLLAGTPAPAGARVYIISPVDGEQVQNPVTVRFGLQGMGIAPSGVVKANTGHHHLLIDAANPPALDKALPSDAQHLHFGGGQTETSLQLSPGQHTLQLILGDHGHVPHDPPVISDKIRITVH